MAQSPHLRIALAGKPATSGSVKPAEGTPFTITVPAAIPAEAQAQGAAIALQPRVGGLGRGDAWHRHAFVAWPGRQLLRRGLGRHLDSGALEELTLTTNGGQLAKYAKELAAMAKNTEEIDLLWKKYAATELTSEEVKLVQQFEAARTRFLSCMSSRAADTIRDEREARGPMKMAEVLDAQKAIIAIARLLTGASCLNSSI